MHEAADRLGYVVDATPRTVSSGHTATIALVLAETEHPVVSTSLIRGVTDAAVSHEMAVLVVAVDPDAANSAPAIHQLRTHRPRCMVIVDSRPLWAHELDHYRRHGGQVLWMTPPDSTQPDSTQPEPTEQQARSRQLGVTAVLTVLGHSNDHLTAAVPTTKPTGREPNH